ncbi:hypothetical protein ABZ477_08455 [Microbacterium sp. NPDC019599]|uniref:hypothetical protein n=1 Tax=Microbacterium sp. NPDC019599 TaxID=3154690 RepID=UPI0033D1C3EF
MRPAAARTRISVVQPEGWVRLRIDDDVEERIAELSAALARSAEPARRDLVRAQLRRSLRELADSARGRAYEVWLPVGTTGGVTIPVTVTVGPLPTRPDPRRSIADVLLAMAAASPGARAVDVGGLLGVRTTDDIPGEQDAEGTYTSFPRRRVVYTVSPPADGEWLAFLAEIIVPDTDEADEIARASEFFVDALMATVAFGDETIGDAATRARAADDREAAQREEGRQP